MKIFITVVLGLFAFSAVAQPPAPSSAAPKVDEYLQFLNDASTRENVIDCIEVMDQLIDNGEHGLVDKQPDPGTVEAATKLGISLEFSTTQSKKMIMYYLKLSRGGKELKYSDATKFIALFTDRAGLQHPVNVNEGDKSTFYARWLIKPSEWKAMRKLMIQIRTANRAERDPFQAFSLAVERELAARANAQVSH
ncbi:MAG: hypothetical protein QM790_20800 [Nibricoccus sp.]